MGTLINTGRSLLFLRKKRALRFLFALLALLGMPAFVKTADALGLEGLGANFNSAQTSIVFRVVSSAATHLEVWIYDQPLGTQEKLRVPLTRGLN